MNGVSADLAWGKKRVGFQLGFQPGAMVNGGLFVGEYYGQCNLTFTSEKLSALSCLLTEINSLVLDWFRVLEPLSFIAEISSSRRPAARVSSGTSPLSSIFQ
jgi:hypothetical protein